jgi:hydroxymethylglutaryl-CoA reductase
MGINQIEKAVVASVSNRPSVLTGSGDVIVKAQDDATIKASTVAAGGVGGDFGQDR